MKNELYERLLSAFLSNIPESVILKSRETYLAYLSQEYDKYFENPLDEFEFNKLAQFCIRREKILHVDKSPTEKEAFLFPDLAYEEFESFSLEVFGLAQNFLKTNELISHERYIEIKELSFILFENVSELFRHTAETLLSETLLELELISGNSKNYSFRLGGYISQDEVQE